MMRAQGELRSSLERKARDLFGLCDRQGKGFATKEDLRALREEFPLPDGQTDLVFDALDADGDGRLTLQEFTDGFGMFLGFDTQPRKFHEIEQCEDDEDDDEMLEDLLDHLGARNLFNDEDFVREMWRRVQKEDPVMRSNFENFVSKMAADLKESALERNNLQSTLKNRSQEYEAQVQSLYAEMEEQLRLEKEQILAQEQHKEQRLRDELETELRLKDQQLQDLLQEHAQMESQLEEMNSEESETKHENFKLQKDRDILESRLVASERMLNDMKSQLSLLRKRSLEEKRKRAQAALKVSEGIALERENLVLELNQLKEINKQLLDEKDELVQTTVQMQPADQKRLKNMKNDNTKQKDANEIQKNVHEQPILKHDAKSRKLCHTMSLDRSVCEKHPLQSSEAGTMPISSRKSQNSSEERSDEDDDMSEAERNALYENIQNNLNLPFEKSSNNSYSRHNSPIRSKSRTKLGISTGTSSPKSQVLRKIPSKIIEEGTPPSRVFKVVFVGDSGVGKTSILHRFCTDDFKPTFSATVGVDFQVKTVEIGGEKIALQLWDTAGQERFRSMTHQYFRKADGIIIVYDVTSETTFRNIRNWIHNAKEGTQESSIILLIGNKVDLCESDDDRVIRTKDGVRIADEFGTLFYETSAKTGDSIKEAIEGLASILKSKEDEAIEQVLKLQEVEKEKRKKRCC
ncbi:EF-hand calcium-binding domain-containing protein 4B-like [Uloborus diversus]|uniref:EF-hand calcium-binding domain-containing protein 4B-like n=1 Tax=Uloborus diversus TaxID=327109 RepID=UPI00240A6D43|nr:EF-hand calcium-binding domain-containing protein 4B-like [Uloborus diversus]